jgi:hypothetical protein
MKAKNSYINLFIVPQLMTLLLTVVLSIIVWHMIFSVMKIERPFGEVHEHLEGILFIIMTLLVTHLMFKGKFIFFKSRFDRNNEFKHFIYFSNLLTIGYFAYAVNSIFIAYNESKKDLPVLNLNQFEDTKITQSFKLENYYIDKSNAGFDKYHFTYLSKNLNVINESFQITAACPIYKDSIESLNNKAIKFWYIVNWYQSFDYELKQFQEDSIFNVITRRFSDNFNKASSFKYVDYLPIAHIEEAEGRRTPHDLNISRYRLASSDSPKYDSVNIVGFIEPRESTYQETQLAKMNKSSTLLSCFFVLIFICPLLIYKVDLQKAKYR